MNLELSNRLTSVSLAPTAVIEFIGLPGTGKTTAVSLLRQQLEKKRVPLVGWKDVLQEFAQSQIYARYRLPFRWRRYLAVRGFVALLYKSLITRIDVGNRWHARRLLRTWNKAERRRWRWLAEDQLLLSHFHSHHWARVGKAETLLVSEGLVHHVASMQAWCEGIDNAYLDQMVASAICEGTVIVHVRVPVATAVERLCQRGLPHAWPKLAWGNPQTVQQIVERFDEAIEARLTRLKTLNCPVLVVENSSDFPSLERSVAAVADQIVEAAGHNQLNNASTSCELGSSISRSS